MFTRDDGLYCSKILTEYFSNYSRIDEYMKDQKVASLSDRSPVIPGFGPEEELFSDFSINPNDMDFKLVELPQNQWDNYLNMISSFTNSTSIPGRNLRLAVLEKNTNKWVGFIRLGSPVINMKPRNTMLGTVHSQTKEGAQAFNRTSIMGFVIVPAQPFGFNYLGGKLMAGICCSHTVREMVNKKYNMNTCLFETTSLYGSSKTVSQYDGMKPYIRFKGLSDSNFIPVIQGPTYDKLKSYVEDQIGEEIIKLDASSRKLKIILKIISMTKASLKGTNEGAEFNKMISNAEDLTEQKRYYISNYGFANYIDVVTGKTDKLVKDENYDKFELNNIITWWKSKAANRYETLKSEGRLRKDIEVWTGDKKIDIIR